MKKKKKTTPSNVIDYNYNVIMVYVSKRKKYNEPIVSCISFAFSSARAKGRKCRNFAVTTVLVLRLTN